MSAGEIVLTVRLYGSPTLPVVGETLSSVSFGNYHLSSSEINRLCKCQDGKEKTLAMIKPDGVSGNYTDVIKKAISDSGFSITQEMLLELDEETVKSFYAEHASKSFFPGLVQYMLSGPVLIMVLEKANAIADWRALIGPTDANNAKISHSNSIRAMCGLDSQRNCVHGSDSPQSADREITLFFSKESSGYVWRHDEL